MKQDTPAGHDAIPGSMPAKKRVIGRPFPPRPLPPAALLAEVRRKVEADEVSLFKAAGLLGRSPAWLYGFSALQGWAVPGRIRKQQRALAPPPMPRGRGTARRVSAARGRVIIDGAARALWRGIAALTKKLECQIAADPSSDRIEKLSASLNKLVAETRRNQLHNGETDVTGDRNDYAGDGPPHSAEDVARMRNDLAAAITDAIAAHAAAGGSSEDC